MATRIVQEKCCPGCGITKPAADFSKHRTQSNGLVSRCKVCTKAKYRETYKLKPAKPIPPIADEEWRDVPGYEGFYSVSSFGRVRREAVPGSTHPTQHLLKPGLTRGYRSVRLIKGGRVKFWTVHKLVALAFVGPRPDSYVVNHKDGDKLNNRPENLEYCTNDDNMRHASETGLMSSGARHGLLTKIATLRGERHHLAKVTEAQVLDIRHKHAQGQSFHSLSREYRISRPAVKAIVNRQSWSHI